jgi:hypothetical protein
MRVAQTIRSGSNSDSVQCAHGQRLLTVVDATGTGDRGWTWSGDRHFNDSSRALTLFAKTFAAGEVTGISVSDLRRESWESPGEPVPGQASATWCIHTNKRVFELLRNRSQEDAVEQLMTALRDGL